MNLADVQFETKDINWGPYIMHCRLPQYMIDNLIAGGDALDTDFRDQLAGHLKVEREYNEAQCEWFYNEMAPIWNEYRLRHYNYHGFGKHGAPNTPVAMRGTQLWINYMTKGEANPPHTHSGDVSFVIYCQIPEGMTDLHGINPNSAPPGSIIFQHGVVNRPQWSMTERYFTPEVGDMFIFPALQSHMVLPFRCDGVRISVSGNLIYTNRDEWPNYFF